MAYSIYQTDCVILGMRETQEHDFILRVFSPVFGYIRIIAKGTRKHTSKLRANIQEYAVAHISTVKGKEFFILTDIRCIFSFIQSKSVVTFLRKIEGLFFDDENDHGTKINEDIYRMLLSMCKLIVWMVSEKKDTTHIALVQDFFVVYVKGLQGFTEKIDISTIHSLEKENLYTYVLDKGSEVEQLKSKIEIHN
jgi:hypothetical protein